MGTHHHFYSLSQMSEYFNFTLLHSTITVIISLEYVNDIPPKSDRVLVPFTKCGQTMDLSQQESDNRRKVFGAFR